MSNDELRKIGKASCCLLKIILFFGWICGMYINVQNGNIPLWALIIIVLLIVK